MESMLTKTWQLIPIITGLVIFYGYFTFSHNMSNLISTWASILLGIMICRVAVFSNLASDEALCCHDF